MNCTVAASGRRRPSRKSTWAREAPLRASVGPPTLAHFVFRCVSLCDARTRHERGLKFGWELHHRPATRQPAAQPCARTRRPRPRRRQAASSTRRAASAWAAACRACRCCARIWRCRRLTWCVRDDRRTCRCQLPPRWCSIQGAVHANSGLSAVPSRSPYALAPADALLAGRGRHAAAVCATPGPVCGCGIFGRWRLAGRGAG